MEIDKTKYLQRGPMRTSKEMEKSRTCQQP